jgi:aldose 1-epimerase
MISYKKYQPLQSELYSRPHWHINMHLHRFKIVQLITIALVASLNSEASQSMKLNEEFLSKQPYGITPQGESIEQVTLINSLGMKVQYIDYACTITRIDVVDKRGKYQNIVLNLPDLESHLKTKRRFAAVIGRYAGRIRGGHYTLNGIFHPLPTNPNGAALHGDPNGFDRRTWERKDFIHKNSMGSTFTIHSPNGDQGHPGNVTIQVKYELMKAKNQFQISYYATTDQPTVLNLTNHAYFNLAGAGRTGLSNHLFQIDANQYLETDGKRLPTGKILSVEQGPLDLRKPVDISPFLSSPSETLGAPPEYDHTMVLSKYDGTLKIAAKVHETTSGRTMLLKTTEPAIQFNTGNGFDKSEIGGEGIAYDKYDGFALETFHFPDSPNQPHFPSTVISPDKPFQSRTVFVFGVESK